MGDDRELEQWQRAWQAWQGQPVDWLRKSQDVHRRAAALQASYWAALLFGAAAVALAVWRFGVVSWFRLGVGVGLLLFGAAMMVYARRLVGRSQRQLSRGPEWLIEELSLLYQLELDGWTKPRWVLTTCAVAAVGGSVALQRIVEAWTRAESLVGPIVILVVYLIALGVIALVGRARVRIVRRELRALQQVRAELAA
jgi:hypothetical protein